MEAASPVYDRYNFKMCANFLQTKKSCTINMDENNVFFFDIY